MRLCASLALALCLLVGCGDDSNSGKTHPAPTPTPTPTATPSPSLPDLAAVSAQERGCWGASCHGGFQFDICIENRSDVDVTEPFDVTLTEDTVVTLPGLAASERACYRVAAPGFHHSPIMEVDPQAAILDSDRSNNQLSYPRPNPTGCDVLCPGPTPTPARLP